MDINQKLRELDELRAELIRQAQGGDKIEALEKAQPMVKPGSKEHEALLATGYDMTKDEAEKIIKERDAEPERWPLSEYRKAKAFLAALAARPRVISKKPPWRVRHHARTTRATK